MWDETDYEGRWIQAICGVFLVPFGAVIEYYDWTHLHTTTSRYGAGGLGIGAIYLGVRCLWYAISGRDNVNRDDF